MENNSADSPISDGGASSLNEQRVLSCSNVRRNPFNENGCYVATDTPACPVGATESTTASTGVVVCGSEGEVANDPQLGDKWLDMTSIDTNRAVNLGLPKDTTSVSDKLLRW